ncbi:hypothetical protein [Paraburkholderia humisilvae]|uniref:Uncharacterized protein n=1 Tax=Paraburkholderia humisilvae TaxID=627669 RepID=A0A6J5DQ77_9BURK|nr:hypothetical protein [Paraburkholderia humisilvae]CAB3755654.1 hypothetical protein LMG29542_02654 [Paraburkholderia humisilvae]
MKQDIKPDFEFDEASFAAQQQKAGERQDWLVDQALMDTFPASDPIALYAFD